MRKKGDSKVPKTVLKKISDLECYCADPKLSTQLKQTSQRPEARKPQSAPSKIVFLKNFKYHHQSQEGKNQQ